MKITFVELLEFKLLGVIYVQLACWLWFKTWVLISKYVELLLILSLFFLEDIEFTWLLRKRWRMTVVHIWSVSFKRINHWFASILREIICSWTIRIIIIKILRLTSKGFIRNYFWFLYFSGFRSFITSQSHERWQYLGLFFNSFSKNWPLITLTHTYFFNAMLFDLTFWIITIKAVILPIVLINAKTMTLLSREVQRSGLPDHNRWNLTNIFGRMFLFKGRNKFFFESRHLFLITGWLRISKRFKDSHIFITISGILNTFVHILQFINILLQLVYLTIFIFQLFL